MTSYKPGLHILATFSCPGNMLTDADGCKRIFDQLIADFGLNKVGEVYHAFPGAGYTAVVCLTESHISIHTWPEFGLATFDVFLSSFARDNADRVRAFFNSTIELFEAELINKQEIAR